MGALAALAALATGCGSGDGTTEACDSSGEQRTVAYREVAGVDPDLTSVDVHPVAGRCDAPVVIWVHGGGYEIGDKAQEMKYKVPLFNKAGWALVSVNYRLTRPGTRHTAKYPDHYLDVAAAVAWVHEHIDEYGGDPGRVALLGHSAGADIVSNLLTNPTYLAEAGTSTDDLVCAGPLDSEGFDKVAAGAADIKGLDQEWVAALSNLPGYLEKTSANHLIAPGLEIPPVLGIVRGSAQRRRIETTFLDELDAIGVSTTRIDARSLTHHEVNAKIGAPGDTVMTPPVMGFLERCFAEAGAAG